MSISRRNRCRLKNCQVSRLLKATLRDTWEIVLLSLSHHYRYQIRLIVAESIDATGTCSRYALVRAEV